MKKAGAISWIQLRWRRVGDVVNHLSLQYPDILAFRFRGSRTPWPAIINWTIAIGATVAALRWNDELPKLVLSILQIPILILTAGLSFLLIRSLRIYDINVGRDRGIGRSFAIKTDLIKNLEGRAFISCAATASIDIDFDARDFYERPGLISAMTRWSEPEIESIYLVSRGALDRPKVALKSVESIGEIGPSGPERIKLTLSACSYYDHHTLQYLCDRKVGSASTAHRMDASATLKSLLGPIARKHYQNTLYWPRFETWWGLPNALGFSAIVRVQTPTGMFWVLQRRGQNEAADRGLFDCSYAGLIDIDEVLALPVISIESMFKLERNEELPAVLRRALDRSTTVSRPLGLVLQPSRLYQPEFMALVTCMMDGEAEFAELRATPNELLVIPEVDVPEQLNLWLNMDTAVHAKDNLAVAIALASEAGIIGPLGWALNNAVSPSRDGTEAHLGGV